MAAGAAGPLSSSLEPGQDQHRTYRSRYLVTTDDREDGPITALTAAGLPAMGDSYSWFGETDARAIVRTPWHSVQPKTGDDQGGRRQWIVTVTHTTIERTKCQEDDWATPLDEPAKWSGTFNERRVVAIKDKDNRQIQNTAQEPFVPALEQSEYDDTLTVAWNAATLTVATRNGAIGRVNSGTYYGLSARKIKILSWDFEVLYYGTCTCYVANRVAMAIRYAEWKEQPLNQGFREIVGGAFREILDARGMRPAQPVPLSAAGAALAPGAALVYFDGAGGNPNPFKLEAEVDFATLGLPALPGCVS